MKLPKNFNKYGLLNPGEYLATFSQLKKSLLVLGPGKPIPNWDSAWRMRLVDNLETLANQLWKSGIEDIFINGSFVEEKTHPNDIDGYFEYHRAYKLEQLRQELNLLDPHKAWSWSPVDKKRDPESGELKLPIWHIYRVELFPNFGQITGIVDRYGNPLLFPALFRKTRDDRLREL